jgi:small-conductance mechanosensitive channel
MSHSETVRHFLSKIDTGDLLIFIITLVSLSLITGSIEKLSRYISKKFPNNRMSILQWVPLVNFSLYFVGILLVFFLVFEPTTEVALGLLASAFIAMSFAIKDTLASVISGIVLLLDKPFQVGDRVLFQDAYGEIVNIGIRSTKLLTLDESLVTIPNHRFMEDLVRSSSVGELGMMVTVDVFVSHHADLSLAKTILERIARSSTFIDANEKITIVCKEILGVSGTVSTSLRTKCIIKDARKEKGFQTEFIMNANKEFKTHNIAR